jgi:Protein of unknown function (DUF3568)
VLVEPHKNAIVLDVGGFFDWIVSNMKTKIFAALVGIAIVTAGCVKTVSDTHSAAVSFGQDSVEGRYPRTLDQVYQAAVAVVNSNGAVITEFIPHDTTNTVRSLQGKVDQCNVWVRVEAVDPRITSVIVETRTKWGSKDIDLAHELEKEIALQLSR